MIDYLNLSTPQEETALQEFLDERGPALERLRERLTADGQTPDVLLGGTVDSLIPLWQWVKSVLTEGENEESTEAPSWVRYGLGCEPTLSRESVVVVDGVISYLCRVVELGTPRAQWRVGHHRIEVEVLGDDLHRGRELELSLREDIAHEHSRIVDRLAKELKKQDGITGVLREDREVLLVATRTWTTTKLEEWATRYLKEHIRELVIPQQ